MQCCRCFYGVGRGRGGGRVRPRLDALDMRDSICFIKNFRLTKEGVKELIAAVSPYLKTQDKNNPWRLKSEFSLRMPLILYGKPISPPVRNVMMLAEHMGLEYELRQIDTARGDHLKPEFIRINPQHTIPVLEDGGAILVDSHAIMAYLVGKYGRPEHDSLYPKDLVKRAMVDARLHFDTGCAHASLKTCLTRGLTDVHKQLVIEVYQILNEFLEHQNYVAGEILTIADICLVSTIKSLDVMIPVHLCNTFPYEYLYRWLTVMEKYPFIEVTKPGLRAFREYVSPMFAVPFD